MRIHFVEDSLRMRSYLNDAVQNIAGAEISGYSETANQAESLIKNEKPDIVILDLSLKSGSGFDVLRSVKSMTHPPVTIVLTNHASTTYKEKCFRFGADYFFDKSLEFEIAVETIHKVIAEKSLIARD